MFGAFRKNRDTKTIKCSSLTVAAIFQIGPDDVFLGEAEHAKTATSHAHVNDHARVSHQAGAFVKTNPFRANRR